MKLEKIRFRNLASLHGEWTIDLTENVFSDAGIFALSGPVGSGKTTVFDAVRLALFGRTSRLDRINQNDNEIMTRGTKDCFAELIFSNDKGRFLCRWSQRRAQRSGNLQMAEHSLAEFRDGSETAVILTSKLEETRKRIREIIRMDFKHFSRAMILPQGQFADFLQAPPEERAPVLEQITGTEIYTEISKKVHETCRTLESELKSLRDTVQGIEFLDPNQSEELKKTIATNQDEVKHIRTEYDRCAALLQNCNALALETEGLNALLLELPDAERSVQDAKDTLQDAANALNAAKEESTLLAPLLLKVRELDTKMALESEHLKQAEDEFSTHSAGHAAETQKQESGKQRLADLNKKLSDLRNYLETHAPDKNLNSDLGSIELLASREKALDKAGRDLTAGLRKNAEELEKKEREIELLSSDREKALKERDQAEESLREKKASGKKLLGEEGSIAGFYETLNQTKQQTALLKEMLSLCESEWKLRTRKTEAENLLSRNRDKQKQNEELIAARREVRKQLAEQLALLERQRLFEAKIAAYEKDRNALEEGVPCPLCGSKNHPYAEQLPETLPEDHVDAVRRDTESAAEEISVLEKHGAELNVLAKNTQQELLQIETELRSLLSDREKYDWTSFESLHSPFELSGEIRARLAVQEHLTAQQEQKAKSIEQMLAETANAEKHLQNAEEMTRRSIGALEHAEMEKKSLQALRNKSLEELETRKQEREESLLALNSILARYGVSAEEKSYLEQLKNRAAAFEQNVRKEQTLGLETVRLSADLASGEERLRNNIQKLETEAQALKMRRLHLENLQKARTELFGERNPANEERIATEKTAAAEQLLRQRNEELAKQTDRLRVLKTRKDETLARIEKYQKQIEEQNPDHFSKTELESRQMELDGKRQEKMRLIGECLARLKASDQNREKASALVAEIESKCAVQRKWEFLNDLIGSSDGKKYRTFVQSLTLETLIENANGQLAKFSDRYTLTADSGNGLEFNVKDAYRGNEIRSTRNLSGGETFLISLALALGLSRMARNRVRIDTLFLDEGFGTLDEETLQHALEQLAGLKQNGKLIGIISHAHGIEDIVPVVLHFENHAGYSTISGPGVSGDTRKVQIPGK